MFVPSIVASSTSSGTSSGSTSGVPQSSGILEAPESQNFPNDRSPKCTPAGKIEAMGNDASDNFPKWSS
eukprot:1278196-Karenia_brevis.AAC.1